MQINWEDAYAIWKKGLLFLPKTVSSPVPVETVFVQYEQNGESFFGYDWLENTAAESRKRLIADQPSEFLFFTQPTCKGTIHTAEMLAEARNEEELAAVWIAATAKELSTYHLGTGTGQLYCAACDFLRERYYLWHHAMRNLVPAIAIPPSVLESVVCNDAEPIMGLIQMNVLLLKNSWSILRYSSLKEGEAPDSCSLRIGQ